MQHKTKKIWLIALLSLLIAALFAASFTYARYYKETGVTGGKYDDTIEFVGANKYIVYSPEELVSAIENGYSYIEIGEGAEDPFVITDGVTDVSANLVLDINGHDLVRNSRNPLIDVQENVSVVIVYDSKSSGSFYNPVGSLLQASGGTLTIATGEFTSGPKADDLYAEAGGRVSPMDVEYRYFTREGRGADAYTEVKIDIPAMPKLSGSVYLDSIGDGFKGQYPEFEKGDTFLIYTEETVETPEGATVTVDFSPLCDVASCDFYYYYEKSTAGSGKDKTTTYAVVYGYHDVMKGAEQQITAEGFNESEDAIIDPATAVIWPYAAVRMTEGEAFIRGGTYTNQFGKAQSYGIYARGGSLSVQGENTSFTSVADGVCIRCTTEDGSAPALNIENGKFTSEIGDTIQISGGEMNVKAGTFKKDATAALFDSTNNGSAISISGGKLSINGSGAENGKSVSFNINGSHVNGVKMEKTENDQTDIIKNAAFSFNHGHGGNSVAAIQVIGGKLEVSSSTFNFNQDYSGQSSANNGIYVQGGSVTATGCTFSLSPNGSVTGSAAIASVGGSVTATGSEFSVKGNSNYGVYSSGGTITATDCTITMTGTGSGRNDNFGIYSTLQEGSTGGTATANGCTITINGTYSAGILAIAEQQAEDDYAVSVADSTIAVDFADNKLSSSGISSEGGNIQLQGSVSVSSQGLGITARTGGISIKNGTTAVTTPRGTGVYVNNGTLTVAGSATLSVDSKMSENSWVNPPGVNGTVVTHYDGVVVQGGSLESNGTLNVTFTGLENSGHDTYDSLVINSFAVRVLNAEDVTIASGNITNSVGGGVYVGGGTVTLGDSKNNSGLIVATKGTGVGGLVNILGEADGGTWDYNKNVSGGSAVSVEGGELYIYGGSYTAALGDGIFVRGGTATIDDGSFVGKGGATAGPAANYGFKMYGGTVTIKGGTFGNSDSDSSGAFVMGTSQGDKATITGGTFVVGGATAFSVWQSATVDFNGGTFEGASTGLAIETHTASETQTKITVTNGTFTGKTRGSTQSGIWYGNSTSKLTVTGGTFTGGTAGLYFGAVPGETNVQLSGGTFYGPKNDLYWDGRLNYGNHTSNNAINGTTDLYYDIILADECSAIGDTELGDNFSSVGEAEVANYTQTSNLSSGRIRDKGGVTLHVGAGWVDYDIDLVYSKITVQ